MSCHAIPYHTVPCPQAGWSFGGNFAWKKSLVRSPSFGLGRVVTMVTCSTVTRPTVICLLLRTYCYARTGMCLLLCAYCYARTGIRPTVMCLMG